MLPALAFLAALGNPAEDFVAECATAVLGIKEGVWSMSGENDEHEPQGVEVLRKGGTMRMQYVTAGKTLFDTVVGPTATVGMMVAERKYFSYSYPEQVGEKKLEPLPPLEEGEFKFNIDESRGFILRSNPPLQFEKVVKAGGKETMVAKMRKSDGKEGSVFLERDAKSKLPTHLKVVTPKETTNIHLLFKARKVDDKELTIDPKRYEGFEKVEPPSGAR